MKHASRLTASLIAAAAFASTATAQDVRVLGRNEIIPGAGFTSQWPGSGFEATFEGKTLKATIYDWGSNWLNVEIDGVTTTLGLGEGQQTYTLFDGAAGSHTIRVTRRTGANVGPTRFLSVEADGLKPTKAPDHRVLVIGDSYASGYGVEGANEKCNYGYETQNAGLAYPALLGGAFGADVHVVAMDGGGLTRNYAGDGVTMGTLTWQTLPTGDTAWAALSYQPQVIVVNLGTGDFDASDPGDAFDDAYVFLLRRLRVAYPDALIIGSAGGSLWGKRYTAEKTSIADAVTLVEKDGDKNVRFVEFKPKPGPGRYGCDSHLGKRAQAEVAAALEQEISKSLGWQPLAKSAE